MLSTDNNTASGDRNIFGGETNGFRIASRLNASSRLTSEVYQTKWSIYPLAQMIGNITLDLIVDFEIASSNLFRDADTTSLLQVSLRGVARLRASLK